MKKTESKILVTGSAGFIGFHLVSKLLSDNCYNIVGLDNINDYYDVNLKYARLHEHGIEASKMNQYEVQISNLHSKYRFIKADLEDYDFIVNLMIEEKFEYVVNLAAQAGVRYSLENPRAYVGSNVNGFLSILEGCRQSQVKHLIYASTSSVYGLNSTMPLSEKQPTDHPMSLYSATKKTNELMAHTYSHLFKIPTTGLRFFTVYGPWGRPDMALFKFTSAILSGRKIDVFNRGQMVRDFTYVDDIVESIFRILVKPPQPDNLWNSKTLQLDRSTAPYRIFNIGNSKPVELKEYIELIENELGKKGDWNLMEMQDGDVPATMADISELISYIGYTPKVTVDIGIKRFINWYTSYFKLG